MLMHTYTMFKNLNNTCTLYELLRTCFWEHFTKKRRFIIFWSIQDIVKFSKINLVLVLFYIRLIEYTCIYCTKIVHTSFCCTDVSASSVNVKVNSEDHSKIEMNIKYTAEIDSCGVEIAMQAWLTVENLVHQNVLDLLWKRHLLTRSICIYMHLIYRSCRSKVSSDTKTEVYT